jgi:hypothetical protein
MLAFREIICVKVPVRAQNAVMNGCVLARGDYFFGKREYLYIAWAAGAYSA